MTDFQSTNEHRKIKTILYLVGYLGANHTLIFMLKIEVRSVRTTKTFGIFKLAIGTKK